MAQDRIQAQLKGLSHASPLFRRQAAFGVFALLQAQPALQKDILQDVVLACVTDRHTDVVEESVAQLLQLAGQAAGLSSEDALHLLLLALTTAGASTVPLLAAGVVPSLQQQLYSTLGRSSSSSTPAAAAALSARSLAGCNHPLCSAVLSHPAAAARIITDAVNWLAAAAQAASLADVAAAAAAGARTCDGSSSSSSGQQLAAVWHVLRPFFSYILLADAAGGPSSSSSSSKDKDSFTSTAAASSSSSVGAAASSACVSQLLCLASCSVTAAALVVPFLLQLMLVWRCDTAAARLTTTQALSDVLDVLTTHTGSSSSNTGTSSSSSDWWHSSIAAAASLLLLLASRAVSPAAAGGVTAAAAGGDLGQLLPLMWRVGGVMAPGVWRSHLLQLGWLLLCCAGQKLETPTKAAAAAAVQPWQAAALQLPLLQQIVFSTDRTAKTWAAAVLTPLKQQQQQKAGSSAAGLRNHDHLCALSQQGPLATLAAVQQLLAVWWVDTSAVSSSSNSMPVLDWLSNVTASLHRVKQAGSSASSTAAANGAGGAGSTTATALTVPLPSASVVRDLEDSMPGGTAEVLLSVGSLAWFNSHGINPAVQMLLGALLLHPDSAVVVAAAAVLQQLLLLLPQVAPGFLPLVLQQLRAYHTAAAGGAGSSSSSSAAAAAALLHLLPAMCRDNSSSALVWRMLQPVIAVKPQSNIQIKPKLNGQQGLTNGLTRSVAVQLAVKAWQLTGKGWTRAEAAINGCIKPQEVLGAGYGAQGLGAAASTEPLELRLLRATAMRDVLAVSSSRGLELLGTLAACLQDPSPGVTALGLSSLEILLDRDELDFYKAWPLVAKYLPPTRLLPAVGVNSTEYDSAVAAAAAAARDRNEDDAADGQSNSYNSYCDVQNILATAGRHTGLGVAVARWVGLLRYGALDAAVYADVASVLVPLMWMCTAASEAQVRAAAYRSLTAWPVTLLTQLEMPAAAAAYIAPVAAEAAALAAVLSSSSSPRCMAAAIQAHRSAVAAAEELAAVAIHHEHANRRAFLAAAGAAARGSSSSTAAASAAVDREEASLRHRLLRVVPQTLTTVTAGADSYNSSPKSLNPVVPGSVSVGALLLLWQPAAAAAADPAAAYASMFDEVASRWSAAAAAGTVSSGVVVGQQPGLTSAAWQAFMHRWLVAAKRSPDAILAKLQATWSSGLPAAAAAALAAATGLAAAGVLGEAQISDLMTAMQQIISEQGRSSIVTAAAITSFSRLLRVLHPSDWASKEVLVNVLYNSLLDSCTSDSCSGNDVAVATMEALGYVGVMLLQHSHDDALFGSSSSSSTGSAGSSSSSSTTDRSLALGCSCLGLLLSCVLGLWTAGSSSSSSWRDVITDIITQLPAGCQDLVTFQELNFSQDQLCCAELTAAALRGCCCLLTTLHNRAAATAAAGGGGGQATTTAAAAAATFGRYVLQQIQVVAAGGTGSTTAVAAAAARLLAVVTAAPAAAAAAAAAGGSQIQQQLSAAVQQLKQLATGTAAAAGSVDGRLAAAAAAASWTRLECVRLRRGDISEQELSELVSWLVAAAAAADPPTAAAAAAAGGTKPPAVTSTAAAAAAGLAVLLGVDVAAGSCGEWTANTLAAAAGGGSSSSGGGGSGRWGLLGVPGSNTLQRLQLARSCLKGLEAATRGSSRVAGCAAWLLAAVCYSSRGGRAAAATQSSTAVQQQHQGTDSSRHISSAAAAPALALYPAAGALKPLAEKALGFCPSGASLQNPSQLAAALEVASCVRVLASAPRLPAADWAGLCRRLLTATAAGDTAAAASGTAATAAEEAVHQLQEGAMRLLLSHCNVPSLELSGVLDAWLNPAGFKRLNPAVQAMLFQGLGTVLAALPVNRAAGVLHGLPALISDSANPAVLGTSSSSSSGSTTSLLLLSCWTGLAQLCQAAADRTPPMGTPHKPLIAALHTAVAGMVQHLPLLPAAGLITPQQLHSIVSLAGSNEVTTVPAIMQQQKQQRPFDVAVSSSSSSSSFCRSSDVLLLWRTAVICLRLLNPDTLLGMTSVQTLAAAAARAGDASEQQQQQLRNIQLRSVLVLAHKLTWKELNDSKHAYLGMPAAAAKQVLLPVALACASAPQAGLLLQLQELPVAAAGVAAAAAAAAENAAQLAAAMIIAWQSAAGSSSSMMTESAAGTSAATSAAAVAAALTDRQLTLTWSNMFDQLPAVMPQLLSCSQVSGSRQGFAEAVCRVLLELRALPGLNLKLRTLLAASVLAVREQLPASGSSCWQELLMLASES